VAIQHDPRDLGTRLYAAVSTRSPNTEPTSFTDALAYFRRLAGGSVRAMSTLMGVPRRTLRDWLAGATPRDASKRRAIAQSATLSARRDRLKPGRESRLRGNDVEDVIIVARYNYSDDEDEREVEIGRYLDADTIDHLVDSYLNGTSPADLRLEFADKITGDETGFYTRTFANPASSDDGWTVRVVRL